MIQRQEKIVVSKSHQCSYKFYGVYAKRSYILMFYCILLVPIVNSIRHLEYRLSSAKRALLSFPFLSSSLSLCYIVNGSSFSPSYWSYWYKSITFISYPYIQHRLNLSFDTTTYQHKQIGSICIRSRRVIPMRYQCRINATSCSYQYHMSCQFMSMPMSYHVELAVDWYLCVMSIVSMPWMFWYFVECEFTMCVVVDAGIPSHSILSILLVVSSCLHPVYFSSDDTRTNTSWHRTSQYGTAHQRAKHMCNLISHQIRASLAILATSRSRYQDANNSKHSRASTTTTTTTTTATMTHRLHQQQQHNMSCWKNPLPLVQ